MTRAQRSLLVVFQRPPQRLLHRGVLGVQPPGGCQLPVPGCQAFRGLARHLQRMLAERSGSARFLPGFRKQARPVGAQGLEHDVPGPPVGTVAGRHNQRAVDQVQYRRACIGSGDRFRASSVNESGNTEIRRNTRCSSSLSSS